jgi:hypothetical protein
MLPRQNHTISRLTEPARVRSNFLSQAGLSNSEPVMISLLDEFVGASARKRSPICRGKNCESLLFTRLCSNADPLPRRNVTFLWQKALSALGGEAI